MLNVDINVDRRTDGQKIGRLYCTLLQAGVIKKYMHILAHTNLKLSTAPINLTKKRKKDKEKKKDRLVHNKIEIVPKSL